MPAASVPCCDDGMDLLILGGTQWLGRTIAAEALARGHRVTCLARGEAGAVADGAALVVGDRSQAGAYDAVADRRVGRGHRRDPPARVRPRRGRRAGRSRRALDVHLVGQRVRGAGRAGRRRVRRAHAAARVRRVDARHLRRGEVGDRARLSRGARRSTARRAPGTDRGTRGRVGPQRLLGRAGRTRRRADARARHHRCGRPGHPRRRPGAVHARRDRAGAHGSLQRGRRPGLVRRTGSRRREPRPGTRARSWPCRPSGSPSRASRSGRAPTRCRSGSSTPRGTPSWTARTRPRRRRGCGCGRSTGCSPRPSSGSGAWGSTASAAPGSPPRRSASCSQRSRG